MADDALLKLSTELGAALQKRHWSLALAESCTGGWASQVVTMCKGSSSHFERGFVTYSNLAKTEMLDVSNQTLEQYGAVSEETAREMAAGALKNSNAQISAAITGIAGPDGATPGKPVGTVCFAWATVDGVLKSETRHFDGDRDAVRRQSVVAALEGVHELTLAPDL
ncbi:MAG TPA: nicotinamide-nucleotide amidohydrolase family protein [Methylophilaceae bacterium]|nr:nicotinamide-nucleotide amidohydrolase family protein [Methylophilaceae bacterium]